MKKSPRDSSATIKHHRNYTHYGPESRAEHKAGENSGEKRQIDVCGVIKYHFARVTSLRARTYDQPCFLEAFHVNNRWIYCFWGARRVFWVILRGLDV